MFNFWKYFQQLAKSVQIVIVLSILASFLAIAFWKSAGENIINVIVTLGAFSIGRISGKHEQ